MPECTRIAAVAMPRVCFGSLPKSSRSSCSQSDDSPARKDIDNKEASLYTRSSILCCTGEDSIKVQENIRRPVPSGLSATYIIYLLPSKFSKRGHTLSVARSYLGTLLGFDESHLYPIHCTLSSFFSVEVSSDDAAAMRDDSNINTCKSQVEHILRDSLLEYFESRGLVKASLQSSLSAMSKSVRRFGQCGSSDTTTASTSDNDNRDIVQLPFQSLCGIELNEFDSSQPLFDVCHVASKARVQFEMQEQLNQELNNVFVTSDGSVILPMEFIWRGQAETVNESTSSNTSTFQVHVQELCGQLESCLRKTLTSCEIKVARRSGEGIQPKAGTHLALTNNKTKEICWKSITNAARMLDSAARFEACDDFWDLVLCELQSWGSLDEENSLKKTDPRRTHYPITPHTFREIVRITRVGRTQARECYSN